jgi:uncharacterized membrane protein YdbT with pleckstrin-like domain
VFRRRSETPVPEVESPAETLRRLEIEGKGRPTPSRREAEAARKTRLKPVYDRKELARRQRAQRAEQRQKVRQSLATGEGKHLPLRDQGPVRQFVRDFVDVRRNVAQYLLPLLLVILVLSLVPRLFAVQLVVWALTIALTLLDTIWLGHRLRTELRTRFEPTQTKGAMSYGLLRSTQLRRLRLPRARLGYGDKLPARY